MSYQYGLDAAEFIIQAEQDIVDLLHEAQHCDALVDLLDKVQITRSHVLEYLQRQIYDERMGAFSEHSDENMGDDDAVDGIMMLGNDSRYGRPTTLPEAIHLLGKILQENKALAEESNHDNKQSSDDDTTARVCYFQTRSTEDTMLFRLTVILQLCLVRIECAQRALSVGSPNTSSSSFRSIWSFGEMFTLAGLLTVFLPKGSSRMLLYSTSEQRLAVVLAGTGTLSLTSQWIRRSLSSWWVSRKLQNSSYALDCWNMKWEDYRTYPRSGGRSDPVVPKPKSEWVSAPHTVIPTDKPLTPKRLQNYQSTLQLSEGEFRFVLLKRFMDVFYASVDAAANLTTSSSGGHSSSAEDWRLQLATAAAATYYSLTGAGTKAVEVTSSSKSARRLLEKAWGMVSLPAIKTLSLQASKLIKGAAVADRMDISGVSCFILSREPVPELAASLRKYHRKKRGFQPAMHRLSTIDESKEHEHIPSSLKLQQPFARGDFRQHDVILHLTGGGFFAHFIGSDLPYLLDWSSATGAVIVCPEYSLLPDNKFPAALQDVESVYQSLLDPNIAYTLGFEVNRLIVSGESVGGNLAAALCIKLQMKIHDFSRTSEDSDSFSDLSECDDDDDDDDEEGGKNADERSEDSSQSHLPNALLLSCPILNLTGDQRQTDDSSDVDPVLPKGLIKAISDAYVPQGIRKNVSLISPLYASDELLSRFPPTLIFASSTDPVLDDAVVLNQRLRSLGVPSNLRAVDNLPHAYLGLGTAGFPEAQQAQKEIQDWLVERLQHD